MALQQDAGLDVVTDGEMRRYAFFGHLVEALEGFDKYGGWSITFRDGEGHEAQLRAAGCRRQASLAPADERRGVHLPPRAHEAPVKVTLLSAQQAAAYYDPDKSRAAYATRDAYLADLVDFTRREIAELRGSAASTSRSTRRSTPRCSTRPSAKGYRQRGSDPDKMLDACIELDNAIIEGHPGITFGIHICRGNHKSMFYASGGYDRIAEKVFSRAQFHRFLLEYDDERSGTFEPLRYVPEDRTVVLGLVSSKTPRMETARRTCSAHRRRRRASCRSNGSRSARNAASPRRTKETACPPTISGRSWSW